MRRTRMALAAVVVTSALCTVGAGAASADPSSENELCRLEQVQDFLSYFWDVDVNHGRCVKLFRQGFEARHGGCELDFFDEDGRYSYACLRRG